MLVQETHQLLLGGVLWEIYLYLETIDLKGKLLSSPFPVYLGNGRFRTPDLLFMREENRHRRHTNHWEGADLVVEVISPDDPNRDLVIKGSNLG